MSRTIRIYNRYEVRVSDSGLSCGFDCPHISLDDMSCRLFGRLIIALMRHDRCFQAEMGDDGKGDNVCDLPVV